jgi:hypothetical protein
MARARAEIYALTIDATDAAENSRRARLRIRGEYGASGGRVEYTAPRSPPVDVHLRDTPPMAAMK